MSVAPCRRKSLKTNSPTIWHPRTLARRFFTSSPRVLIAETLCRHMKASLVIQERTQAGLTAARRAGRTGAVPPKLTDDDIEAAKARRGSTDAQSCAS